MEQNRYKHNSGAWVVHEGLQNNPDIKIQLEQVCKCIQEAKSNNKRHLADSALILNSLSERLEAISKELFKRHEFEKKNGVK